MRKLLAFLGFPQATTAGRPHGPKPREQLTDSDWVRLRAPVRQRDESLSETAIAWATRLPVEARPRALCARFPRIANRLAVLWRDPGLAEHYLDDLTLPRRPGRQGFPAEVSDELLTLQLCNERRLYVADEPGDPDPQAPSR